MKVASTIDSPPDWHVKVVLIGVESCDMHPSQSTLVKSQRKHMLSWPVKGNIEDGYETTAVSCIM
jgi:hypothetical protein